jgi:hypothetical protein
MYVSMKSSRHAVAYIALLLASVVGGTCAADEQTRGQTATSVKTPVQATNATSPEAKQCAGHEKLVGPDGHIFPLAYVPGDGCQYVVDESSEVRAVGPNGYAFTWTREDGWKLLKATE